MSNGSRGSRAASFSSGNGSFSSNSGSGQGRGYNRSFNGSVARSLGESMDGSASARSRVSSGGRSRSVSFQTQIGPLSRSRTQSLVQIIGQASIGGGGRRDYYELGVRSRASSLARLEEVSSIHRRSGSGATQESERGDVSVREISVESPVSGGPGEVEDDTFGHPIRSGVRTRVDSAKSTTRSPLSVEIKQEQGQDQEQEQEQEQIQIQSSASVSESHSNSSESGPAFILTSPTGIVGSSTLPLPISSTSGGARPQPSFLSSAHDSMVTHPTVDEQGTTSSGSLGFRGGRGIQGGEGEGEGETSSSYGTMMGIGGGGRGGVGGLLGGAGGQGGMGPA